MSNKRKKRQKEWEQREAKRNAHKRWIDDVRKAFDSGDIEEAAKVFGVPLKPR